MTNWLKDHLTRMTIQPLIADIKTGRVRPSAVMLAIRKLTDEKRKEIAPALEVVYGALQWVMETEGDS